MFLNKLKKDHIAMFSSKFRKRKFENNFPFLKSMKISNNLYSELNFATGTYIVNSLKSCFPNLKITENDYEKILIKYKKYILKLPNLTPSGVLRPKHESYLEYNKIIKILFEILNELNFIDSIHKMKLPITVRILDGRPPKSVFNRPRIADLYHSDFWLSACADMTFLIPVMGDIKRISMRFGEPVNVYNNFLTKFKDYNVGNKSYDKLKKYNAKFSKKSIYFYSPFCVHSTHRSSNGGLRVSIDWTAQSKIFSKFKKLCLKKDLINNNHFSVADWGKIGSKFLYYDNETFSESKKRFSKFNTINNQSDLKGQAAKNSVSKTSYIATMRGKKNLTLLK